ncbi:L-seryl-tRNA(Sec) selenium transferase [Desulfovibrio inopinatus]|uniref:L-seryl-tRNA(Sec) selenium transferase n=1 Tax=Desulfovibrio inopinatus TaxID=102109 RepID=UPI000406A562|nr:L-seryl-tRNA(Sec) selenium transferase [Desulfovibrio inopinatus]
MSSLFRLLPSVDVALTAVADVPALHHVPRALLRDGINLFLDRLRRDIRQSRIMNASQLEHTVLWERLVPFLVAYVQPHFRRVINATGVVVHTNLGRSILAEVATRAVTEACARYSNLEMNLDTGGRGSRYSHVEDALCRLTGAEAALVVNNNAAAVLLVLETLAKGREVIVSRGQLVEIGGSFRIPEVMEKSGATLREVGATNRTHLRDYEQAINENTAALLKVHASNYRIIGFTKEVSLPELAELGSKYDLPVIEDLGSGNFSDFSGLGLLDEPTVQKTVADGADVVTFSGDKVLGGPQAGIIVGKKEYIDRIKKNPLNRAVRIDKMTLAALEATLRLYLDPEKARREIPTVAMILADPVQLASRGAILADDVAKICGESAVVDTVSAESRVGGGAFPEQGLPTTLVRVRPAHEGISAQMLKERLLETDPPVIGRIEHDVFCLDVRTVADDEFELTANVLNKAIAGCMN